MRILAVGMTSRIVRVASIPLTRGMRTSISTTSGANSSALAMASWPSSASATTSMPSSDSRTMLRPRRNRAWSSAMRTRMGSLSPRARSSAMFLASSWLARVDQSDVAVVPAVHDRCLLGFGIGEEVEVVTEQVHLQRCLLRGHRLDREALVLHDPDLTRFEFFFVGILLQCRVYRSMPPRMRSSDQLPSELFDLVLQLGDDAVNGGEGVGSGRLRP